MLDTVFAILGFISEPVQLPPVENLEIHSIPQLVKFSEPVVKAKSAIVVDLDSGKILFEKNAQEKLPIASLTKLMTAIIVRENYGLDDLVTVSSNAAKQPPAKVWLSPGEQLKVGDLLKALLIESANDAATALAEKMGMENFVEAMNAKAVALGLHKTRFGNPVGYDDENAFSTTTDLATLAKYFLRDEFLREVAKTNKTGIASRQGILHELYSTNNLFGSYLEIQGLKTGRTDNAGECLAAIAKAENGKRILAIVLNSPKRFQEAKALLTWAEENHRW